MTERKINNGLQIYEDGNPANKSILFIHGFPLNAMMWRKQFEFLRNDFYCMAYDVRGLGKSEIGDGQYTLELFTDDLIAVLDEFNVSKTVICGLSMGGYIAMRALEKYPERFNGVILCDTKAEADDNAGKIKRAAAVQKIITDGAEKYVSDFVPLTVPQKSISLLGSEYTNSLNEWKKADVKGLRGCQLAMLGRTDQSAFLRTLTIPALVICGQYDSLSTPAVMGSMAASINGAQFHEIPDAGHLAPWERPDLVNPILNEFLKTI